MIKFPEIPKRSDVIQAFKAEGGLVAGVLPIYYSRALLRAFNILPVEIWGPPKVDAVVGATHVQPYICSIDRNALSFIQSSSFQAVDLVLVPHACDSLQGLGSILLDLAPPNQPVLPMYLPRGEAGRGVDFLSRELKFLYQRLKEITGYSPSVEEMRQHILREEEADLQLALLHKKRKQLAITDFNFYRLIRSREYLPSVQFLSIAKEVLDQVQENEMNGIPIVFSGIVPEPMELLLELENVGGRIVADDMACSGRRLYPAGKSEDPFLRMAESLLGSAPSWGWGSAIQARFDHLMELILTSGARGVVFYNVKFCEPELFDLPILREALQSKGVPSTLIEMDINDPLSNQTLTRLEAFLEMIA